MKKNHTLLFASFAITLMLIPIVLAAQSVKQASPLTHEMSPEELLHKDLIGKHFVNTAPPTGPVRNIAEFEQMEGALIRYTFGIPYNLIAEMSQNCVVWTIVANASERSTVTGSYTTNGVNLANCRWIYAPTNSYWTRDYGPWFIHYADHQTGIIDFPYNRPRPLDDSIPKFVADSMGLQWFGMNIIHTGGNYMTTGLGYAASTVLTTNENPNLTVSQIDQMMQDYLGITNYQIVPDPNTTTTIDHIDCWGKFLGPDKILIRKAATSSADYTPLENAATYWAAQTSPWGTPFKVYRVNTPGTSSKEAFSNSVILNNKVLLPFTGVTSLDTAAQHVYEQAMPGYTVLGFLGLASAAWQTTDALHCRVMGLADRGMLEIIHMPLSGTLPLLPQYTINATIYPYSHKGLYPDSTLLYYKVNNGSYTSVIMTPTGNNNYTANIPGQTTGTIVYYYIHAADSSGRNASHAIMGALDPHYFEVGTVSVGQSLEAFPAIASLGNCQPNPFISETEFNVTIRTASRTDLSIFNIQGQKVRTVFNKELPIGNYRERWPGTGDNGARLAPGLYFYRLTINGLQTTKKLVIE